MLVAAAAEAQLWSPLQVATLTGSMSAFEYLGQQESESETKPWTGIRMNGFEIMTKSQPQVHSKARIRLAAVAIGEQYALKRVSIKAVDSRSTPRYLGTLTAVDSCRLESHPTISHPLDDGSSTFRRIGP